MASHRLVAAPAYPQRCRTMAKRARTSGSASSATSARRQGGRVITVIDVVADQQTGGQSTQPRIPTPISGLGRLRPTNAAAVPGPSHGGSARQFDQRRFARRFFRTIR
jgi:hypothetical protein